MTPAAVVALIFVAVIWGGAIGYAIGVDTGRKRERLDGAILVHRPDLRRPARRFVGNHLLRLRVIPGGRSAH